MTQPNHHCRKMNRQVALTVPFSFIFCHLCHFELKSKLYVSKHLYLKGLDENERELAEEVLLSSEDTITEETSSTETFDDDTKSDVESHILVDDLTKSSLQEKVERFIQTGELEAIEGKSH